MPRIFVEAWDPEYGRPFATGEMTPSLAEVDPSVEIAKSHHVSYLEPDLERVVGSLEPFERTPLFLTTTSYRRYSTYLRLEGDRSHPFSGVVRLELSAESPVSIVQRFASLAARTLPRYGSVPHKDPRAPENLFPIGALERELRRRLGDHGIVHRALRAVAARSS